MKPASVLILGSGPVVIGQAAEFDYAGTQACRALRAEGVRTILVNSNPATIMTDPQVADVVYLEALTVEAVEAVIVRERPEGLLAGLGGQTALNLAVELAHAGILERYNVRLVGNAARGHRDGRGSPALPGAARADRTAVCPIGDRRRGDRGRPPRLGRPGARRDRPARDRPARRSPWVAPAAGSSRPRSPTASAFGPGLRASPIGQVMVERCLVGWGEIEYEVMRDADDTCIAVCSMENVDPLGVHTGDSIVVAPVQTLPDAVHQRLRSAALEIIRALGVEGGCNVQFALSPDYADYAVIEVNPRVSRSSALASKATGYPIARVAAQIAAGRRLAEIPNVVTGTTVAAFEPALDYVVVKLPRFPFDKFPLADRSLGSQMKATGEVMAIDRTFGAALNKALRGLEQSGIGPLAENPEWGPTLAYLTAVYSRSTDSDADAVGPADGAGEGSDLAPIRWVDADGPGLRVDPACRAQRRADRPAPVPGAVRHPPVAGPGPAPAGRAGGHDRGSDRDRILVPGRVRPGRGTRTDRLGGRAPTRRSGRWRVDARAGHGQAGRLRRSRAGEPGRGRPEAIRRTRLAVGLEPGYAMVDTCAAEFAAETPYFYSTYAAAGSPAEAPPIERPAALVIGSGPVRIGQGIEFDYCAVQAADTLRRLGWNAVMINSNPETVSTDFDASSRLYFEPLDPESVLNVIEAETRPGEPFLPAFVQFGGQTPLNLAAPLAAAGVTLLGADLEAIDQSEERTRFSALLDRLGIPSRRAGWPTAPRRR